MQDLNVVEKNRYMITLAGCDDSTSFEMLLTDEECELLRRVSDKSNETSTYCCMPTMFVEEVPL